MNAEPKLIAVTGATGFTGPFVVRALKQQFPRTALRAVVRPTSDTRLIDLPGVSTAIADLRDPTGLARAFADADTLVNVASLGFDWVETIVKAAEAAGIRRAIFIGTTAMLTRIPVTSRPLRERGEQLVMTSQLEWTILRPTMIYGTPGDRNIARLIKFMVRSPIVPVVAHEALQQPIHVEDVASAVAGALASPLTVRKTYNLSGREPLPLRSLLGEVAEALGRRRVLIPVPTGPILALLSLWSHVGRPPFKAEQVRRIAEDKNFDHVDAARDFGFSPRSFRDGIASEVRLCSEELR